MARVSKKIKNSSPDFLVIGGGVVGITCALELKRRQPQSQILVIEKESSCGEHASSRNSGVLHAGFYYTHETLKARFSQEGNKLLTRYCDQKKLPILKCGKLVVARNEAESEAVLELQRRGERNGVPVEVVSASAARRIEPRVKTFERALFSPTTSTVNPAAVMKSLVADAQAAGIEVVSDCAYLGRPDAGVLTSSGEIKAGYVLNCAGLYADKVAMDFGFSKEYRMLPFKGLYLYSDEPAGAFKTHIYPVPDLRNPFLGVHFTLTADGHVKIGPTATPALWREQYEGWKNFKMGEFVDVVSREASLLFFSGFDFKRLAVEETLKYFKGRMVKMASELAEGVKPSQFKKWGKPGIRAQLMHVKSRRLEMDFVIEGDAKSCHVLNAVSPGFTCSMPFAVYVCDKISAFVNK